MRKLKFKLDRKSLEKKIIAFIGTLLKYGDIIRDNCIQYKKQEIKRIEAARIATGTTKLVSLNALYRETSWITIEKRRENHKLVMLDKMCNVLTPSYLSSLVPQSVPQSVNNLSQIQPLKCRQLTIYSR